MSESKRELLDNGLPKVHRFITDHTSEGKAVFTTRVKEEIEWQRIENGDRFSLGYSTNEFPVQFNEDADIKVYENYLVNKPGIIIPGGTVLRYVDIMPNHLSPIHRTVSLDYGVVLEGEVELLLDEGESRLMKRGDISIQRGTIHGWRNPSKTEWARMLYVLQPAKPMYYGGKELGEDYGVGMSDVKPSAH